MGWWQERKAKKNFLKYFSQDEFNALKDELTAGRKQLESDHKYLRNLESPTYNRLIKVINQIAKGTASREQKKLISIKLVEDADLSDYERSNLLQQINYIYEDVQEKQNHSLDKLVEKAEELVREKQKASTAMFQKEFKINYLTAVRIMDELEDRKLVGPSQGEKARKVFIK